MSDEIYETLLQYIQNEQLLGNIAELDEVLCDLVVTHSEDPYSLKRVLQCIYRLLQQHNKWQVNFGRKVFHKLIDLLPQQQSRQLVANILTCAQIYIKKYPKADGNFLLEKLWSLSLNNEQQPHAAQILVQLFDEIAHHKRNFACSEELLAVIRQLLVSNVREERKSAHFLMRKATVINCDSRSWNAYVAILESLEENQSHLILPSLELLHTIDIMNDHWQIWLNLLYTKLLSQSNVLVLRWTLEYFLANISIADRNPNLLQQFLEAANNTSLYNVDGYYLPEKHVNRFLTNVGLHAFLEAMTTINWRPVPFHFWLHRVVSFKKRCLEVSPELLYRLAASVRIVQNPALRYALNRYIYQYFDATITNLKLSEYIAFIETLHNVTDPYHDHHRVTVKLQKMKADCIADEISKMSKRFYDIFTNLYGDKSLDWPIVDSQAEKACIMFAQLLTGIPTEQHSWVRFLIVFVAGKKLPILENVRKLYNLDLQSLSSIDSLPELYDVISKQLKCQTKAEKSLLREKCVDFFVENRLQHWRDLQVLDLSPLELLDTGTQVTFWKICKLLAAHDGPVDDEMLPVMVITLKKFLRYDYFAGEAVNDILTYAKAQLTPSIRLQLAIDILNVDMNHDRVSSAVLHNVDVPVQVRIHGMLYGEPATGDARIEAAYEERILYYMPNIMKVRRNYHDSPTENTSEIFNELLRINNELSVKNTRYYEHSKEHRLKIRIVYSMLQMRHMSMDSFNYWSDEFWTALFSPSNQLNISYLYEWLIVRCTPNLETIMKTVRKITEYTPSQQNSLISVVYNYCMSNRQQPDGYLEIIQILLPLTMGVTFQTRLLAQLVVYRLILECEKTKLKEFPLDMTILRKTIEQALGDKLEDYMAKEVRLMFHKFERKSQLCTPDIILYVTNAPFDECANWCLRNGFNSEFQNKIDGLRATFKNKSAKQSAINEENDFKPIISNAAVVVQRKMNPTSDILPPNDLVPNVEIRKTKNEMFVVASLIDKLPNLGGIARTCEVLGLKNLVLDSKMHVEKSDFKNLSMTAEKNLHLLEVKSGDLKYFLLQKQSEGFKIVGAEQTANSTSFVDFIFPRKCVLLLGHEKHGIPADLLGFLDYAVEIPQFGLVRSLNVHVTGALFMWEYCKQHIVSTLRTAGD